jgi:DNA-binding NtrC family response regulator
MITAIKILLVDDDPMTLEALGETIRLHFPKGSVDLMDSPFAALDRLATTAYDVVVTDFAMPRMSGLTLLEKTHQIQAGLPIIVITGHSDIETEVRARGAYAFLMKPVQRETLIESVGRAVHDPRFEACRGR